MQVIQNTFKTQVAIKNENVYNWWKVQHCPLEERLMREFVRLVFATILLVTVRKSLQCSHQIIKSENPAELIQYAKTNYLLACVF